MKKYLQEWDKEAERVWWWMKEALGGVKTTHPWYSGPNLGERPSYVSVEKFGLQDLIIYKLRRDLVWSFQEWEHLHKEFCDHGLLGVGLHSQQILQVHLYIGEQRGCRALNMGAKWVCDCLTYHILFRTLIEREFFILLFARERVCMRVS